MVTAMKKQWYQTKVGKWFVGDAMALDEMGNAVILDGDAHESISAHCGSQIVAGEPCAFCSAVCWFIQRILGRIWPSLRTHCRDSWKAEKKLYNDSKDLIGG